MARKKNIIEQVIDGHMTHSWFARDKGGEHINVLVFASDKAEGEPVGDWRMPAPRDYTGMATLAVRQTSFPQEAP